MHFGFSSRHHHCHSPSGRGYGPGDSRHGYGSFGRSSSRTRMFEQGDLRFVVLKLLAAKPAHGYDIIKQIEEKFDGAYAPSPGIVYPTLTMLEEQGLIAVVETDGPRKLFGLTEEGRVVLARSQLDVDRVFSRMEELRERYGGRVAPEITRAMENLKSAVKLRLQRGDTPDPRGLTAILDGAARAIEEL